MLQSSNYASHIRSKENRSKKNVDFLPSSMHDMAPQILLPQLRFFKIVYLYTWGRAELKLR
jgi:hypothetical protein